MHGTGALANAPIIGGFNTVTDKQSANERSINIYPEKVDGKSDWRLRRAAGLRRFCSLPEGPIRGEFKAQERLFVAAGNSVYEVFANGTFKRLGPITALKTPVSMDDNGKQLIIADSVNGWVFDLSTGVYQQITNPNFYPSPIVVVEDGYAVFVRQGTQQFFLSGLYDALSYDALDFASAEQNPDNLVTVAADSTGLTMLGAESTELFWNTGNANQVFQRRPGSKLNYGCVAIYSLGALDNGLIWVGRDANGNGSVFRMVSGIPTNIATIAITEAIQSAPRLSEAVAFVYQQSGHTFYSLTIPGLDTTFVYDTATNFWHERRSYRNGVWGAYRVGFHALAFGLNIAGDIDNGNLYVIDPTYYFDDEDIIRIERDLRPYYDTDSYERSDYNSFTLDCTVGVGADNDPNSDPLIMLQVSNDGGLSYGSERAKPLGKAGKTKTRVQWRRLGSAVNISFRISYAFPTEFSINNAYVKAEL